MERRAFSQRSEVRSQRSEFRDQKSEGIRSSQFAADSSQEARIGIEIYALGLAPSMIFENLGARIQNDRGAPGFYRR